MQKDLQTSAAKLAWSSLTEALSTFVKYDIDDQSRWEIVELEKRLNVAARGRECSDVDEWINLPTASRHNDPAPGQVPSDSESFELCQTHFAPIFIGKYGESVLPDFRNATNEKEVSGFNDHFICNMRGKRSSFWFMFQKQYSKAVSRWLDFEVAYYSYKVEVNKGAQVALGHAPGDHGVPMRHATPSEGTGDPSMRSSASTMNENPHLLQRFMNLSIHTEAAASEADQRESPNLGRASASRATSSFKSCRSTKTGDTRSLEHRLLGLSIRSSTSTDTSRAGTRKRERSVPTSSADSTGKERKRRRLSISSSNGGNMMAIVLYQPSQHSNSDGTSNNSCALTDDGGNGESAEQEGAS